MEIPLQMDRKRILFYNPSYFQMSRKINDIPYFTNCKINNCEMLFDMGKANRSDALIIHHLNMKFPNFRRPSGQVWIMIQHESPKSYGDRFSAKLRVNIRASN